MRIKDSEIYLLSDTDGEEGSDHDSVASEEVAANMMNDLEKQWPKVSPHSSPKQNEFLTELMKSSPDKHQAASKGSSEADIG
jgi:hypothetical protein